MSQLLPFRVDYETYALELDKVQEIVEDARLYPLPESSADIAGAIAFHGRIVPVIDLPQLLDFPNGRIGRRLIVLINSQGPIALGVDQVEAIVKLDSFAEVLVQEGARPYVRRTFSCAGRMISLLDLDQLQLRLTDLCTKGNGE